MGDWENLYLRGGKVNYQESTIYIASDGKRFDSRECVEAYQGLINLIDEYAESRGTPDGPGRTRLRNDIMGWMSFELERENARNSTDEATEEGQTNECV